MTDRLQDQANAFPIPAPPPGSEVTADDVIRAQEAWRKASGPVYRNLLDAKQTETPKGSD